MARNIGRNLTRRGVRRQTDWTATPPNTQFTLLAANTVLLTDSFVTSGDQVETLVRTRGLLTVLSDQASASEEPFGAWGIAKVSDQAFAIGASAIPFPYTNAASDLWLAHGYWACPMVGATLVGFSGSGVQRYEIDSKAMRKLTPDETFVVMIENANATDGVKFNLDLRLLAKLS